jgi:hypothetical protein
MGLRPTQGDEKRLLFSNYCPWKHRPPLCHLDRSEAQWRDLRFSGPFLEMFFDRAPTQRLDVAGLFSTALTGQGKTEKIAAGGYRYELVAGYCIAHWRSVHALPGIEVP